MMLRCKGVKHKTPYSGSSIFAIARNSTMNAAKDKEKTLRKQNVNNE